MYGSWMGIFRRLKNTVGLHDILQVSGILNVLNSDAVDIEHQVVVKDAVPLFHTSTLAPLLETAATMVDAYASKKGLAIVGFYQVGESGIFGRF